MTAPDTIRALRIRDVEVSERTTWTLIEIETQAGLVGSGEASLHHDRDVIAGHLTARALALKDESVQRAAATLAVRSDTAFCEVVAICAIDQALVDLQAQAAGCSIAQLLVGSPRATLAVYANINRRTRDRSVQGFAQSAADAVAAGMAAVKIAPFDRVRPTMSPADAMPHLELGLRRIAAVRSAVGRQVRLMVDCHWRLSPPLFAEVLRCAAEQEVFWLETPYPEEESWFDEIAKARALANAQGVRLAGGEMKVGLAQFQPLLQRGLYDVVMPDIIFAGGYDAFMRIAHAAVAWGTDVSPHNPNGPVCHAHSVQISAAIPGFLQLEMQFDETPLFRSVVKGQLPAAVQGSVTVPGQAGLGLRYAE